MNPRVERARVLITVKAAPEPSSTYGDTVCVAGIRTDGAHPEWIRLYPFPFRWMPERVRFKKYDVIEVDVHRGTRDDRRESYRPDIQSIEIVDHLDHWRHRHEIVGKVAPTSTCELHRAALANSQAPSLGVVPVASVEKLEIVPFVGWTEAQLKRIADAENLAPLDLFGDGMDTPPELQAPRFTARYRYHCFADGCPSHTGQLLDWELGELQRRHLLNLSDDEAKGEIEKKFLTQKFASHRETSFFVGNFGDKVKRGSFSILGIYAPTQADAAPTLF
ncbi:hypothetical protein [Microbacterium gorillae]|uniref:hypothetical protein n=1 Tax=Microbacterium gorillae TaxID=1231063 RepID=UPI003D969DFC